MEEKTFPTPKQVLNIATYLGYCMLRHGAEISRVEDTADRICMAYGATEAHVFAIYSTIIVSVSFGDEMLTQTRRVASISTNLDRVDRLNDLSRKICAEKPDYVSAVKEIDAVEARKLYPPKLSIVAYALISGSFALFFGGNVIDGIVAAVAGIVVRLVMMMLEYLRVAPFITTMTASAVVTATSHLANFLIAGLNVDIIIIGILMNLVPGVAITTSLRDFLSMDYMCGMSRLTEALLTATAIAIGASVVLLWQ